MEAKGKCGKKLRPSDSNNALNRKFSTNKIPVRTCSINNTATKTGTTLDKENFS